MPIENEKTYKTSLDPPNGEHRTFVSYLACMDWSTVTAPITTSAKMGKKISAYLRHFDQYVQFFGWKKKWWKGTNVTTAKKESHNFESSFQPPLNQWTFPKNAEEHGFFRKDRGFHQPIKLHLGGLTAVHLPRHVFDLKLPEIRPPTFDFHVSYHGFVV